MAFSASKTGSTIVGNKRMVWGTYTNASGDTGGDINTTLRVCENLFLTPKGTATSTTPPVVNETFPIAGSAVTIVTASKDIGYWTAIGK